MNKLNISFWLILSLLNGFLFEQSSHFIKEEKKDVPFANFSLVPNFSLVKINKIMCLSKCQNNEFCSFIVYKNKICSLHTQYALNRLIHSNLDVVFKKKLIIEYCNRKPCVNEWKCINQLNGYKCICLEGFFGKNCDKKIQDYLCQNNYFRKGYNKSCEPCANNFSTYANYSFNCYHIYRNNLNFKLSKSYCEGLNSTLWKPKTFSERNIYLNYSWIDSEISYVGEPFLWPDGKPIYEFLSDRPNNQAGNNTKLLRNVLRSNKKLFEDHKENLPNTTTICQQNN